MLFDAPAARVRQRQKIVPFAALSQLRAEFAGLKIVQCHGAFDLVHIGHLNHFEEARALGDLLVVTITADRHVTKKRAVTFTQDRRARQVAALEIVDYVAIVDEPTALSAIAALHPDFYVKGPEYADLTLDHRRSIFHEIQLLESYGGRIHFTAGETFSSTKLAHFLLAAPEAAPRDPLLASDRVLFRDISALGFALEQLKAFLARAGELRACVIGETVIDEWVDVTLTNLSTQSRCVAGLETGRVRQVGGAGIIGLHLANFVRAVRCYTNPVDAPRPGNLHMTELASGEVIETRFVDRESGRPVFKTKKLALGAAAAGELPDFDDYDLVLIADFGHGLLDAASLNDRIARRRRSIVAVMAQVNSSNFGYNLPMKYAGADYYSLNRLEAELCLHQRGLPLADLVERVFHCLGGRAVSVSDGADGVMVRIGADRFALPSLSVSVVDTIGCGDAHFALSSVAIASGLPAAVTALAGSIGAAAMTQRRCNDAPVTEAEFLTIGKIVI